MHVPPVPGHPTPDRPPTHQAGRRTGTDDGHCRHADVLPATSRNFPQLPATSRNGSPVQRSRGTGGLVRWAAEDHSTSPQRGESQSTNLRNTCTGRTATRPPPNRSDCHCCRGTATFSNAGVAPNEVFNFHQHYLKGKKKPCAVDW
ncbi:hypothetical protein GCM10010361_14500 [Streptomyces olivaceiscleroticus]|uniref:Uncharacterized protein n=1 Tax=Streptomyces olivaceiscleroticus TaxID=68245 RepID=A0ABN0ZLU2_9ACTN